eukprot:TRINITY_DN55495_c0_g1_i1.p1 TRINITY_DN55495_c0_g1~~TRINITY_DN55495_c0_g1_i1.p1  ORF type:complete len:161 (-),score=35.87 TRINITY_DN55495_c0_g1_i1:53-535(-)
MLPLRRWRVAVVALLAASSTPAVGSATADAAPGGARQVSRFRSVEEAYGEDLWEKAPSPERVAVATQAQHIFEPDLHLDFSDDGSTLRDAFANWGAGGEEGESADGYATQVHEDPVVAPIGLLAARAPARAPTLTEPLLAQRPQSRLRLRELPRGRAPES